MKSFCAPLFHFFRFFIGWHAWLLSKSKWMWRINVKRMRKIARRKLWFASRGSATWPLDKNSRFLCGNRPDWCSELIVRKWEFHLLAIHSVIVLFASFIVTIYKFNRHKGHPDCASRYVIARAFQAPTSPFIYIRMLIRTHDVDNGYENMMVYRRRHRQRRRRRCVWL